MLNIIYAAVIVEVVCLVAASNDIDSVEVTVCTVVSYSLCIIDIYMLNLS